MEEYEINKLKEENKKLQLENESMRMLLKYEFDSPYSGFSRGSSNHFDIKNFDSYEKFQCLISIFKDLQKGSSQYRSRIVESRLLRTLLYSENYSNLNTADFDAKYVADYLSRCPNELSKKDIATLMRHVKINTETYIDNLNLFSPYFNTLKKQNPDLKDESVKLINEVAGTKKKNATRQEKLERRQGMLYAWKDYSSKEMYEYHDSFEWKRMLTGYKTDCYGRSKFDEEFIQRLHNDGYLYECMKQYFNWQMSSFPGNNVETNTKNSISYFSENTFFTSYTGNISVNELFPPINPAMETIFSNNFITSIEKNQPYKERIWDIYADYLKIRNYTHFPKLFLNMDPGRINIEYKKCLRNMFNALIYIEELYKSASIIKNYIDSRREGVYNWTIMNNFRSKITFYNIKLEADFIYKQCEEKTDKIMLIIERILDNPKTKEYITSDKYWNEFCSFEDNSDGEHAPFEFKCNVINSNGNLCLLDCSLWENLENLIINS